MGKKKSRTKYVSKGERCSVSKYARKLAKRDRSYLDDMTNKLKVFIRGGYNRKSSRHNPWVRIPNPNPKETKRRWIRVRISSLVKVER